MPTSAGRLALYAALAAFTLLWLLPVFGSVVTSFRTMDDLLYRGFWAWPRGLTLQNFSEAWRSGVSQYLLNSFRITLPSLAGTLFLSSLAAFALAVYRFKLNRAIYYTFVGGMLIPFQVLMIPVFRLTNSLGLYDTQWGVILVHTAFQIGFCTFLLRNFMRTIPFELVEAARIDGCPEFKIFWSIFLPLTLPALAAAGTLEFTWIFNDYLWPLVLLRTTALKPVTAGLAVLKGEFRMSWTVIIAGSLLASLPTIGVFVFLQRYFIQGLTMGSGK